MYVIAVLNQKGGSGKTTIATHLARAFQLDGYDVLLVDSDPQGSARDWAAVNPDQPVAVVGLDRPTIDRDLRKVTSKDIVVIDGAPQAADLAVSAIKAADLVLIPVQPSPYDIWAASDLVDIVKQRMELSDDKLKAAFIVSRAIKGTRIGSDVVQALEGYNLPVLASVITQRVAFPETATKGVTVLDDDNAEMAKKEIMTLLHEVKDIIRKNNETNFITSFEAKLL